MAADDFAADIAAVARVDAIPTMLEVVCRFTGMRFAAVARVTEDRWIACAVHDEIAFGLVPGGELPVETTICDEIRQSGRPVIIDHVAEDDVFRDHHTPAMYGLQSYISMPICRAGGRFFGTLCAIDPKPAGLSRPEVVGMFRLFADLIAMHLDADERTVAAQRALTMEREQAEQREKFVAILGHDLRNPLASLAGGLHLLRKQAQGDLSGTILHSMETSVARMTELVANVLDFAAGRLGDGVTLTPRETAVDRVIESVVSELRVIAPDRRIEVVSSVPMPIVVDPHRIAQLLSNLVGNALTHGAPDAPVRIEAAVVGDALELSVANAGAPIPERLRPYLFQPFVRGAHRGHDRGLGLGLFIAAEIARAHGGTIDVVSSEAETRFTLRVPLAAAENGAATAKAA